MVITEAGGDHKVTGLVYVAAFGLDAGESVLGLAKSGPSAPLAAEIRPDDAGFLKITDTGIDKDFAQDLPEKERHVLQSTQVPTSVNSLGAPVTQPAWKNKPSWYIVASSDRAIPPQAEQAMASRMGASTTTVPPRVSSCCLILRRLSESSTTLPRASGRTSKYEGEIRSNAGLSFRRASTHGKGSAHAPSSRFIAT